MNSRSRVDVWQAGIDVVFALTLVWEFVFEWQWDGGEWGAIVLTLGAVALRRRFPLAMLVVMLAVVLAVWPDNAAALVVAVGAQACLFAVALAHQYRVTAAAAALLALALYFAAGIPETIGESVESIRLGFIAWSVGVAGVGAAVRSQRQYVQALHNRAERIAHSKEIEVRRRVVEERLRIARDLHDSVAHSIAVVNLHAGSAQANLTIDPVAVERALVDIRASARTVLQELQQILSILRSDEPTTDSFPGHRGLQALIASFGAMGLEIDAQIDNRLDDASVAIGVATYRILQEALTNAHRHGAGNALVRVHVVGSDLSIDVVNDVRPGAPRQESLQSQGGFGLIGMRERVTTVGGVLRAELCGNSFEVNVLFRDALVAGDVPS